MTAILPGATIGILGGGQLGRMTALAARSLGYAIHVLDPDPRCACAPVADRVVAAAFDDDQAAADLARHCDVVTLEIEQIATASLDAAARHAPVRPGSAVLGVIQDRSAQKRWLVAHGFPVGPYADVPDVDALRAAARRLGPLVAKSCRGGYDGRSQTRVASPDAADVAWRQLNPRPDRPAQHAVAERALDLAAELSILVARSAAGDVRVYPAAENHHERQVLAWSILPATLEEAVTARAARIAGEIARDLGIIGLLAVEMFLTTDGELLVNELAPRPHNSFHTTELACETSQFEQLVRAVCGLPLGATQIVRPAAIVNIFGDAWSTGAPRFDAALAEPGTRLFLYGKGEARPGRKMGHLAASAPSARLALDRARAAAAKLAPVQP